MKNIFKTTLLMFSFAIGGILFQISCSNDDATNNSQNNNINNLTQINKLVFTKGAAFSQTIWICDYDGSNLSQIPITLPVDVQFNGTNGNAYPTLSPDGQTLFFVTYNISSGESEIYSCNVDGSNVQPVYNAGNITLGLGSVN